MAVENQNTNPQQTEFGQVTSFRPVNAYTSPTAFATDYTVIQQNLSNAGLSIMQSVASIQAERKRIEKELRDSYNDYTQKRLIEANKMMGQKVQETMNLNIESFDDFINMSEQQKQRTLMSVDEFNNANKLVEKSMAEIGSYKIDIRDTSKPSVLLISEMQKGNSDAFEMIPFKDGRIGADYLLKLRDENGNFTGETVTITQDQLITQLGTVKNVEPVINGLNKQMLDVATKIQPIINLSASRGVADADIQINREAGILFQSVIMDDTKEAYYSNIISPGEDYHPSIDPRTGEKFKNEQEKLEIWNLQDALFLDHIKKQLKSQTYQPAVEVEKNKNTSSRSGGGQQNYKRLDANLQSDLIRSMSVIQSQKPSPTNISNVVNTGGFNWNQKSETINGQKVVTLRNEATSSLVGKTIMDNDKRVTIKDAYIDINGKLKIAGEVYDRSSGEMVVIDKPIDYDVNNLNNILEYTAGLNNQTMSAEELILKYTQK